jgi:hypothetical protein
MFSALVPAYIPRQFSANFSRVIFLVTGCITAFFDNLLWLFVIYLFANVGGQTLQRIQAWSPARLIPNLLLTHLLFNLSLLLGLSLIYALISSNDLTVSLSLSLFVIALGLSSPLGIYKTLSWLAMPLPLLLISDSTRLTLIGLMPQSAWNTVLISVALFLLWKTARHLLSEQNISLPELNKFSAKSFLKRPIKRMTPTKARDSILKQISLDHWLNFLILLGFIMFWSLGARRFNLDDGTIDFLLAIAWFGAIAAALLPTGYAKKAAPLRKFLWLSGATSTRTGVTVALFLNCLRPCLLIVALLLAIALLFQLTGPSEKPSLALAIILCTPAAASLLLAFALAYPHDSEENKIAPIGLMIIMWFVFLCCYWFSFWASGFELILTIGLSLMFSLTMSLISLGISVRSFNKQIAI